MSVAGLYLYDIGKLAEKLSKEFDSLPYEKFAEDAEKVESAVGRLVIMKERWDWLPRRGQEQLTPIDWPAVTGRWDRQAGRHAGIDTKQLWETIKQKLPEVSSKVEELLKSQS
jgi:uncharacterized protein with HEPN domain